MIQPNVIEPILSISSVFAVGSLMARGLWPIINEPNIVYSSFKIKYEGERRKNDLGKNQDNGKNRRKRPSIFPEYLPHKKLKIKLWLHIIGIFVCHAFAIIPKKTTHP